MTLLKQLCKRYFLTKKILLLLACALLLSFLPGTCSAEEITTAERIELQTIFSQLEINCNQQEQQLATANELLMKSNQQITKLQSQLAQANQSINQAENSLNAVNKSFQAYSAEQKKIQQRLKIERDLAILGCILLALK